MFQLIETICFESGAFQRIPLHENRMNRSRYHLFGRTEQLSLDRLLCIPESLKDQKVKCRVTYSVQVEDIEYEPYIPKKIRCLQLVRDDTIDYTFKLKDREQLNRLLNQRGRADEILIVKNGFITDTSYTNIAFLREGKWFTPASPLLSGTRREEYLQKNLLFPCMIRPDELHLYQEARLINAMLSLEDTEPISTTSIFQLTIEN